MALSIKHPEADRLARAIAEMKGETLTQVVVTALRERYERETGRQQGPDLRRDIERIQQRIAELPRRDGRSEDDILGYDEHGLPR